jgi:hypothetical protein
MSQSADKVIHRLRLARQEGRPITLRLKRPWRAAPSYGYVVAVTKDWVAVQILLEGFYLDDVALVRLQDIKSVKMTPEQHFVSRVVGELGVPVTDFASPDDATLSDLLRMIAERAQLVMFYRRNDDFSWREVGSIRRVGEERLELHAIEGDGTWAEASGLRSLHQIERVEFGGRYLTALERFGDEAPAYDVKSTIGTIGL